MTKRKRWLVFGILFMVVAAAIAAFLEPNQIVPGLLAGEPFYKGRPVRYWREVLRRQGQAGTIPKTPSKLFYGDSALLILLKCARDPDPQVRWPAVSHLGDTWCCSPRALNVLIEALQDDQIAV